jgi:hypothetical protein
LVPWCLGGDCLVLRRFLDVIDDDDVHGALGRFELQAKLFLNGGEDGRPGGLRRRRTVTSRPGGFRPYGHPPRDRVGRPLEPEIVLALESCLIQDVAFQLLRQNLRQRRKGKRLAYHLARTHAHQAAASRGAAVRAS